MKKLCVLLLLCAVTYVQAQPESANWLLDFEEAKTVAAAENKPILIYFTGSDWCGYCKKLKADVLETERFKAISDAFVLVYVDLPRNRQLLTQEQFTKNRALAMKYNKRGSYPNLVGMTHDGEILGNKIGYNQRNGVDPHFKFFDKLLKK